MKYTATSIRQTCDACPSQWDINALPQPLYARYRWGVLTVEEDLGDTLGECVYEQRHGDDYHGYMSTEELMRHTAELIDWTRVRETEARDDARAYAAAFVLPTHCVACRAVLMGGATVHKPRCHIGELIEEAKS